MFFVLFPVLNVAFMEYESYDNNMVTLLNFLIVSYIV